MDKEMFVNPHNIKLDDTAFVLSVVTCTRCGCLVADADIHENFHKNHGHVGQGFTNEWPK